MGSKQSSENKLNKEGNFHDIKISFSKNSIYNIREASSSYIGITTSENNEVNVEREKSTSSETTLNQHTETIRDPNLVSTIFVWKEGGNNVYLTGSFVGWNQRFLMMKKENEFILELVY